MKSNHENIGNFSRFDRRVPHTNRSGSSLYFYSDDSDPEQFLGQCSSSLRASEASGHVPDSAPGMKSLSDTLAKLNNEWINDHMSSVDTIEKEHRLELDLSSTRHNVYYPASFSSFSKPSTMEESNHLIIPGVTTTLMIRHIPIKFTPDTLREYIDHEGFKGKYDYCYMPMDFRSHRSLGYCFINFYDSAFASEFLRVFGKKKLSSTNSEKVLSISAAARQGLLPNVASFKLSTLKQMPRVEFRPVVAILGQLVPLDEDTYNWLLTGVMPSHKNAVLGLFAH
jgi:hypothetical protein